MNKVCDGGCGEEVGLIELPGKHYCPGCLAGAYILNGNALKNLKVKVEIFRVGLASVCSSCEVDFATEPCRKCLNLHADTLTKLKAENYRVVERMKKASDRKDDAIRVADGLEAELAIVQARLGLSETRVEKYRFERNEARRECSQLESVVKADGNEATVAELLKQMKRAHSMDVIAEQRDQLQQEVADLKTALDGLTRENGRLLSDRDKYDERRKEAMASCEEWRLKYWAAEKMLKQVSLDPENSVIVFFKQVTSPDNSMRMKERAHLGDPCQHCGTPHDEVEPGPCPGK